MFCSGCGKQANTGDAFCSGCGKALNSTKATPQRKNTVKLSASQMKVPYASLTDEQAEKLGGGPYEVSANSPEAKAAKDKFNPAKIPNEGDLVPIDCVWAFDPHPGDFPGDPTFGAIDEKFVAMGFIRGRTFDEIVSIVGSPMTDLAVGNVRSCVWGKTGFFSMWQIGIRFDKYGISEGIFSQTNV